MKLLYLVGEFHWCGASISFMHLLKGVKTKGVEVFVVAPSMAPVSFEFVEELCRLNIPHVQIPMPWDVIVTKPPKIALKSKLKCSIIKLVSSIFPYETNREKGKKILRQLIQEYKPDIVHTNVGVIHIGFEICKELGIPHVWHIRDYHDLDFHWKPLPSWDVYMQLLKQSDAVITITDDIRKHYGLWDSPNAYTIYNGCFDADDVAMDLPKDKFFFSASRLIETKGHKDVVKAFDSFWQKHQDYQLIMAGIGQDKYISQLKNLINSLPCRKSVKLIGHQKDVRPWMRKAKALVVASYNEGFGRMTAEAAFCGCLVIGRNTGGTKEILNVIGGFPFENDDAVNGMYKRMDEVANLSDSHYQEMAERAQLKAVGLYSNESYVEKVYAVYQQLLKS